MSGEQDKDQMRNEIAQEKFGKDFEQLDSDEKMSVGGTIGGRRGGEGKFQAMTMHDSPHIWHSGFWRAQAEEWTPTAGLSQSILWFTNCTIRGS